MKRLLFFCCLSLILFSSYGSASIEINYSSGTSATNVGSSSLTVTQLRYDPYPVSPGDYFDVWIKIEKKGSATFRDVRLALVTEFPFSLDIDQPSFRDYGDITAEPLVAKYRVRVDKNAVEGENELKIRYTAAGLSNTWLIQSIPIQVTNVQTDFDLVVQQSTSTSGDVSLAIANTGKNTANSMIVRIPQQEDFRITGTDGQLVGNLASGDYSIVSFSIQPTGISSGRNSTSGFTRQYNLTSVGVGKTLQVEIDYTDSIGERRKVTKSVYFSPQMLGGYNSSNGGLRRGTTGTTTTPTSIFSNIWFWITIVLLGAGYYLYRKNKLSILNGRRHNSKDGEDNSPDWVNAERSKKK